MAGAGGSTSGVVLRNSTGAIVFAATAFHLYVSSALHGEFMALLYGLQLLITSTLACELVETDFLLVVTDVNKGVSFMSPFGSLVANIVYWSTSLGCNIRKINRLVNGCAHNLAKYAVSHNYYSFWVDSLPTSCCNPDLVI